MRNMNICVVGAGNVGTQIAAHCAEKGHKVNIYTSKPNKINRILNVYDENENIVHSGKINEPTNSFSVAFGDADLIFLTIPPFMFDDISSKIEKYAKNNIKICIVPGTGGGEFCFRNILKRGGIIFGLQRVPSVARLIEYGSKVKAVGYRKELHVASLPNCEVSKCCEIINQIFDIKCIELPNYLNLTLTPSNPILHTTRLNNLFKEYYSGMVYSRIPLFYEEWNDETSELLLKCDEEVQSICRNLEKFDLSYVISLKKHYDCSNITELTKKIRNIKGFKGIECPMVSVEGGYIPDFESRYFKSCY